MTGLITIENGKPAPKSEKGKEKADQPAEIQDKGSRTHIPAGSFVKAVLLNGVDAPTGSKGKGSPYPVLLRILDLAQLPNHFRSDFKECFAIGEAFCELSNERTQFRVNSLSCMSNEGKEVESKISAYAVGEDGKLGLSGRVVTKQGAILGRSLLAGFLTGAGSALTMSSYSQTQTVSGFPVNNLDPNKVFQASIGAGVSKAAEELSRFYLDMAKELFPVCEVNAGRKTDLVFMNRATLNEVKQ